MPSSARGTGCFIMKRTAIELARRYAELQGREPLARNDLERRLDEEVRELRRELLSGVPWNTEEIIDEIADVYMILIEVAYQFAGTTPIDCVRDKISRKFNVDPDL